MIQYQSILEVRCGEDEGAGGGGVASRCRFGLRNKSAMALKSRNDNKKMARTTRHQKDSRADSFARISSTAAFGMVEISSALRARQSRHFT